mmetsp:Transcript_46708/g.61795  ORF Transcript_46708/g.61795 Transcript_46708/m.61795 type:complete len:96 (+) Transcript_46708:347-634(+)|eukprot:CAMPEP_0185616708 /NCGR_PEP_ID=MMETSP0436-20130131/40784_1 /TAXON_ID=626734 ORGANISM="Favella taraikaensis, Strain Fe Narragansett Bay" /NCGR_SAMPLE_ID=MMETSP0436 /ASSEMBLY_ACC=CAM_ASM_000390 /LENGTH=95 /DNA_ID=CAMNT_0028253665 /DNA_START=278 /DNA_END=565 /DNA_ORIENTATION=-
MHNSGSDKISEIRYDAARTAQISGKNKKGAASLGRETVLCEVVMESGQVFKVRSFIKNAKLIEFNGRLKDNVDILASRPEQEGYLAIVMLPVQPG